MEKKGNPIDSVIQYQLHKKTSGEGGDSFKCAYSEEKTLKIEPVFVKQYDGITQEDLDNDKYLRFLGLEVSAVNTVSVSNINITPQDILNNKFPFIIYKEDVSGPNNTEIFYNFLKIDSFSLAERSFEQSTIFELTDDNFFTSGLVVDSLDNTFMLYIVSDR